MKRSKLLIFVFLLILIFLLPGCTSNSNSAEQAITAYIQAIANKDSVQISNISCADWEADALAEIDSLASVGAKVENLSCKQSGKDGPDTYVSCTGYLALDYNGEAQQIDLSARMYIARQEDGEWRMCGYH